MVEEILVTEEGISLKPNEIYQLDAAVLSTEAQNTPLNCVSSNPEIVTVSREGMLHASESHEDGGIQAATITIQAENGVTKTKTITVDFSIDGHDVLTEDIDAFVPEFLVEQKIRLAGTSDWEWGIEAEVGDTVEIQIQYKNLNNRTVSDVRVRDILPTNLVYIPGSTKLYNSNNPDGRDIGEDTVATTTGINIGHYDEGANAYIRFTARVVDATLEVGSNTLVSWSQACVSGVTLQDYATVTLQKFE